MFSNLSNNLSKIFDKLRGKGFLHEDDVNAAMREIRVALLEADVALPVAKEFVNRVKEKSVGQEVLQSVSPGQQVVKIVSDELAAVLASEDSELNLKVAPPAVIMMLGLQGSGKTTSSAKLAALLKKKQNKKVLLASLDTYRPAAQDQLEVLAGQVQVDSLPIVKDEDPIAITKRAMQEAKVGIYDVLILDTAGRLHTDEKLMQELDQVQKLANPIEKLLVADALTGQDAVNIATEFNEKIGVTGIVLTRIDGDARGGAALSMRHITGQPIKFLGVGEKTNEFEAFDANRIASRILDMGDVVALVEEAKDAIDEKEAEKMAAKFKKGVFDMNDLLSQFRSLKKMGGVGKLMGMIPGMGKLKEQMQSADLQGNVINKQEAIILSMTKKERKAPFVINASRKKRIAAGSGTSVSDVNKLLKQHMTMSKMMKKFSGMGPADMKKMENMLGGQKF